MTSSEDQEQYAELLNTPEGQQLLKQAKDADWKNVKNPSCKLVPLSEVNPQQPKYLWEPYLRSNNLNVLRGDGGTGKTMVAFAIAAAITTGIQPPGMPGILNCKQGSVIYYGAEDDPEEYAYRAKLCGCNTENFFAIAANSSLPTLSDLSVVQAHVIEKQAKLIIFDPLQAFLGAHTDMNRANEVRPLLDSLRLLCREQECTAIIIEHLNKAAQQKAIYRGIGSVDIVNASRSTLMVGYHPDEEGMSVILQIKANAKYGQSIKFSIDDNGQFQWHGSCDIDEEDVAKAKRYQSNIDERNHDPVLKLLLAVLENNNDCWQGTSTELLAEGKTLHIDCSLITSANAIGKRLPGLHSELIKHGIVWEKSGRVYRFTRQI